jgi:hypothetical protein
MSNGSDIAAEIAAALADVGNDTGSGPLVATVTRAPGDAAVNPWDAVSTTAFSTFTASVIQDAWKFGEINGTSILATDLKLMMAAGVVVPDVADTITVAGEVYNIMDVMPEAVGGVDLFYIIQARK